jgi:hypothetical protein
MTNNQREDSGKANIMETGQAAEPMWGDKLYQKRARAALPILIRQAIANETIIYSDLAQEIDMPNPRNLNYVLGSIGETLKIISARWETEIPPINCLVINKNTQLPGDGVYWFVDDVNNYKKLTLSQKRDIVKNELVKIFTFSRWNEVLEYLDLPPAQYPDYSHHLRAIARGNYGVGESQAHREFKNLVSKNPQLLGLPISVGIGEVEFMLPSNDVADVLFKNGSEWVVAEVKSHISDIHDIYRGLYQCIKYQALIEAYQREIGESPNCRVVLVLEGNLPEDLLVLKNILQVEVIDEITVD